MVCGFEPDPTFANPANAGTLQGHQLWVCYSESVDSETSSREACQCDTPGNDSLNTMAAKQIRKASKRLTSVLAANLRNYRREKQLSQESLAELCGLHRTYVGSVERGERNVTLSSLEVLARSLGVSVPELLTPRSDDDE